MSDPEVTFPGTAGTSLSVPGEIPVWREVLVVEDFHPENQKPSPHFVPASPSSPLPGAHGSPQSVHPCPARLRRPRHRRPHVGRFPPGVNPDCSHVRMPLD